MTDGSPHRRRNLDIVQKAQLHISEVKTKITDLLELPTEKRGEDFDGDLAKCTKQVKSAEVELQAALVSQPEPDKAVEKRAEVTETSEEKAEVESCAARSISGGTSPLQ